MTENLMAATWTPETKVYRRLKSGRRAKGLGLVNPTSLEVVYRLFQEIERGRVVMKEEGLPDDPAHPDYKRLNWRIRYYVAGEKGRPSFGWVRQPRVSVTLTTQLAIGLLRDLDLLEREDPLFLAIEWNIRQAAWWEGNEPKNNDTPDWETKFNGYPEKLSEITEVLATQKTQK